MSSIIQLTNLMDFLQVNVTNLILGQVLYLSPDSPALHPLQEVMVVKTEQDSSKS